MHPGISGSPDIPTLNLMGFEDEYFGVYNSGEEGGRVAGWEEGWAGVCAPS